MEGFDGYKWNMSYFDIFEIDNKGLRPRGM